MPNLLAKDQLIEHLREENAKLRHLTESNDELVQGLLKQLEAVKALSVTQILIRIVPGEDGEGVEVYAKSVEEVEKLLGQLGEKAEDYELETRPLRLQLALMNEELEAMKATMDARTEYESSVRKKLIAKLSTARLEGFNDGIEAAAKICDNQHDRARTLTGAARADACASQIRTLKRET